MLLVIKGVMSLMKSDEILELLEVSIDLVCILKKLSEIDDGCGADFSEVLTDLKWSKMTLENRLKTIRSG